MTLPNVQDALTQLHSKRIDGILYDTTALGWAEKQQPDSFTLLGRVNVGNSDVTAVGLKKGSPLTPALQKAHPVRPGDPGVQGVPGDLGSGRPGPSPTPS